MNAQNQGSSKPLKERISQLREDLEAAKRISAGAISDQIKEIGFKCIKCGECCAGEDNSVLVFPFEIRRIMAATGDSWPDTAQPPADGEWDSQGNFHTLEWRLKKKNGSCKFCFDGECKIYAVRPFICSTYPFYLDNGILRCSECLGLCKEIEPDEAERIAALVIERSIVEIEEAIALLEKYEDFERGGPTKKGACVVHDSEGVHILRRC